MKVVYNTKETNLELVNEYLCLLKTNKIKLGSGLFILFRDNKDLIVSETDLLNNLINFIIVEFENNPCFIVNKLYNLFAKEISDLR